MSDLPVGLVRVCGKYRLRKKIGSGSFGDVFSATNVINGADIAVKLEPTDIENPKLREEWKTYKALGQGIGIPRIYWFGLEHGYHALVMSLLGPSLGDLFDKFNQRFSIKTVLMLAIQLISRLEFIHDRGYVHRDMKPDNLLMGTPGHYSNSLVHIVDFGLAALYRDPLSSDHIPYSHTTTIIGTVRYLSINGHMGVELTRRDDLESLAYILIYFLCGSLPWQGLESTSRKKKSTLVRKKKASSSAAQLCKNLPNVFEIFLQYARSLPYDATPDYTYLRSIFHHALELEGYINDNIFDWNTTHVCMSSSGHRQGLSSSNTAHSQPSNVPNRHSVSSDSSSSGSSL